MPKSHRHCYTRSPGQHKAELRKRTKIIQSTQFRKVSLARPRHDVQNTEHRPFLSHRHTAIPLYRYTAIPQSTQEPYILYPSTAQRFSRSSAIDLLPTRLRSVVARRASVPSLMATRRRRILLTAAILVGVRGSTAVLVVLVVIVVCGAAVGTGWCAVCRTSVAS